MLRCVCLCHHVTCLGGGDVSQLGQVRRCGCLRQAMGRAIYMILKNKKKKLQSCRRGNAGKDPCSVWTRPPSCPVSTRQITAAALFNSKRSFQRWAGSKIFLILAYCRHQCVTVDGEQGICRFLWSGSFSIPGKASQEKS